jgi:hypothetical protein
VAATKSLIARKLYEQCWVISCAVGLFMEDCFSFSPAAREGTYRVIPDYRRISLNLEFAVVTPKAGLKLHD